MHAPGWMMPPREYALWASRAACTSRPLSISVRFLNCGDTHSVFPAVFARLLFFALFSLFVCSLLSFFFFLLLAHRWLCVLCPDVVARDQAYVSLPSKKKYSTTFTKVRSWYRNPFSDSSRKTSFSATHTTVFGRPWIPSRTRENLIT